MKFRYRTLLPLCLLLCTSAVQAGLYVHGSIGYGSYSASGDYMGSKSTDRLRSADLPATIGLGYRIRDWLALDTAHLEMDAIPSPASLWRPGVDGSGQRLGIQADAPLTEHSRVFLRGGPFRWDVSVKPSVQHGSDDFRGRDHFIGAGVRFTGAHQVAGSIGWERYAIEDIELDYIQFGIEFYLQR